MSYGEVYVIQKKTRLVSGYTAEQSRAIGQEQFFPKVIKKSKKTEVITD